MENLAAMTKQILIADDHILFGDLLETYLVTQGFKCSRAFNYDQLIELSTTEAKSSLDIVLLDVMMPGFKSAETLKKVVQVFDPVQVVALTSVPSPEFSQEAIAAGLSGYLQKTMPLRKIPIVLEFIMSGEIFVEGLTQRNDQTDFEVELSALEKRVLAMLAQGLSNKEIALATDTTETGVKSINRTLSRKFNVKNRTQLALKVVKEPRLIGLEGSYFTQ